MPWVNDTGISCDEKVALICDDQDVLLVVDTGFFERSNVLWHFAGHKDLDLLSSAQPHCERLY